jgi:hypothetical protein
VVAVEKGTRQGCTPSGASSFVSPQESLALWVSGLFIKCFFEGREMGPDGGWERASLDEILAIGGRDDI